MKHLLFTLIALISASVLLAQSPNKFHYQAVVRDANGEVIPNKILNFRVTIQSGNSIGPIEYEETHIDTTNQFGLLTLVIGEGTAVSGSMNTVQWGNNAHVLKIEFDPTGGTNYQRLTTTQFLSVPYALHAKTATYAPDEDADTTNELQTISLSNDTLRLSKGGFVKLNINANNLYDNDSTNELISSALLVNDTLRIVEGGNTNSIDLSSLNQSSEITTLQAGAYKDSSSSNEIQMLSISNDTIYLSNGGFVVLPAQSANYDNDSTNELISTLAFSSDSIHITDAGGTKSIDVSSLNQSTDISTLLAGAYKDSSASNEIQMLSISNDTIYLSNGGFVVLPSQTANYDNDSTNEYLDSIFTIGNTLAISQANGNFFDSINLSGINYWNKVADSLTVVTQLIGIGTSGPTSPLHITNSTHTTSLNVLNSGAGQNIGINSTVSSLAGNTAQQQGIVSIANGTGTGEHFGVWGESGGANAFSRGVFGYGRGSGNTAQNNRGVQGTAESTSARWNLGVAGFSQASTSGSGYNAGLASFTRGHATTNYGVVTLVDGTATTNYGAGLFAYGIISTTGSKNIGQYGYAFGADTNIAMYGYAFDDATASKTNIGMYSIANRKAGDLAGWFKGDVRIEGNVTITGSISKGSGTFKIDHPLDPENKYLVHSFVESPDMMNVYNGNITTDNNGFATVELPQYFEASNKDFRYQLTPIGQFAQCIIIEELSNNKFVIQTDKPNVKVSWQVTGIRNDPYAKQYRIQAEQEKPQLQKGLYLHPEVYGKDANQGENRPVNAEEHQRQLEKVKASGNGATPIDNTVETAY